MSHASEFPFKYGVEYFEVTNMVDRNRNIKSCKTHTEKRDSKVCLFLLVHGALFVAVILSSMAVPYWAEEEQFSPNYERHLKKNYK